jgi:uncharacterized protein (DUF1330 family)
MKAYVVVEARSSDPQRMAVYRQLSTLAVSKYGGSYLIRGGGYDVLEGDWRPERLVVVEFESSARAREFYDSPEYRAARGARAGASDFQMLLVEGYST